MMTNVINVIFNQRQLIDHVLNNVPSPPPLTMWEMLEAACEPSKSIWVKRVQYDIVPIDET